MPSAAPPMRPSPSHRRLRSHGEAVANERIDRGARARPQPLVDVKRGNGPVVVGENDGVVEVRADRSRRQRIVGAAEAIATSVDDAADAAAGDAFARVDRRQRCGRCGGERARQRMAAALRERGGDRQRPRRDRCLGSVGARSRAMRGSVSVPVLSNTTCVAEARSSSASGRTTSTPRRVSTASARVTAAGAASANAQGHATTSTATVAANARSGSTIAQPMAVHAASNSTRATKPAAARSPARARRGRVLAARAVNATMPATAVSAPTRVTRTVAGAPTMTLPAQSCRRGASWRRRFAAEQRLVDAALRAFELAVGRNGAAVGDDHAIAGPSSIAPTRSSDPSGSTRSANTGVSRASASDRSPARWRARISR